MVMTISMVNAPPPSMTGGRDSVRRCQAYEACEIPEVSIGYAHVTSKYATIPTAIVIPMEGGDPDLPPLLIIVSIVTPCQGISPHEDNPVLFESF